MEKKYFVVFCMLCLLFTNVFSQENWISVFSDDFEDGNSVGWYWLDSWSIDLDNSYILKGDGSDKIAKPTFSILHNYSVEFEFQLEQDRLYFYFRNYNPDVFLDHKYMILIQHNQLSLFKDSDTVTTSPVNIDPNKWYTLKGIAIDNELIFTLDNQTVFEYQDDYNPYLYGRFAFKLGTNTKVKIDNIEVFSEYQAKVGKWINTGGPSGGLGYDIRIHPDDKNMMFVTDNPSGINKSIDGGKTWESKNEGLVTREGLTYDGIPVFAATIDPSQTNIVWIGMQDIRGVYKSTDYGETWVRKINGIEEELITVRGIGIHPTNSDTLFIGTEIQVIMDKTRFEYPRTKGKIYKSVDGGDNWYQVWEGGNLVRFVLYNYNNPNILYASTGIFDRDAMPSDSMGVGILKSTDGGETWVQKNNGIENLFLGYLEIHPHNPDILYAASGLKDIKVNGGIYKTTDGAETWKKVLDDIDTYVFTGVTISQSDTNIVYAGSAPAVYRSDDAGKTWNKYSNWGPPGISTGFPIGMVVDPDDPMTVFINNYGGGNFKSSDGGQSWVTASKGYTGAQVMDLNIDKKNPMIIYETGESGPFKSMDGGHSWIGMFNGPVRELIGKQSIGVHPLKSNEVLLGSQRPGGILKSTDYGENWKIVFSSNKDDHAIRNIEYAPSDPNIVHAICTFENWHEATVVPGHTSHGVLKSTDAGETWNYVNNGLESTNKCIMAIAISPFNPDIVFIGTNEYGIYKTTNGGQNWESVNNGLLSLNIRCLAYHPSDPNTVFAGLSFGAGMFKTTNGGNQWESINNGIELSCASYLNPIGHGLGFSYKKASWYENQMKKAGAAYSAASIPWVIITSIAIDPSNPNRIFASDCFFGVYYSLDGGDNWLTLNEGLQQRIIYDVLISDDGKVLYAGSSGNGVYRMLLQNYAPQIHSVAPEMEKRVEIAKGDSMEFTVNAFDLNADSLVYQWHLNDQKIPGAANYFFYFKTESLDFGEHLLDVTISDQSDSIKVTWPIVIVGTVGISEGEAKLVNQFKLYPAYPNPFNCSTSIRYNLQEPGQVTLTIYNSMGQRIHRLVDEHQSSGEYKTVWSPRDIATGIYFCKFETGNYVRTQKLILQK